jgi:hypothetical protein
MLFATTRATSVGEIDLGHKDTDYSAVIHRRESRESDMEVNINSPGQVVSSNPFHARGEAVADEIMATPEVKALEAWDSAHRIKVASLLPTKS